MLTKKQVVEVCLIHSGYKQCRYLVYDQITNGYLCCKKIEHLKEQIDVKVEEFIKDNKDYELLGRPTGNNCPGFLFLNTIQQGL